MPNILYLDDTGVAVLKSLIGEPTDEQVIAAVNAWLNAHPEATTTVQDGSITDPKLVQTGGVLSQVYAHELDVGTRNAEYYSGNVGDTVTVTQSGSSDGYILDVSAYAGKCVVVHFDGTGTSSRATLLCDESGVIYQALSERYIRARGYYVYPTATANRLYISYSRALTTNLHVYVLDNLYGMADAGAWHKPLVAYVSTNGSDSGNGSMVAPFATIQKAIDSGAERILVRAGAYDAFRIAYTDYPVYVGLWQDHTDATSAPEEFIVINGTGTGNLVHLIDCADVTLDHVYADSQSGTVRPFIITNCKKVALMRCVACNCTASNSCGFQVTNTNGTFDMCEAFAVNLDGYNFHGYGDTTLINCVAHNCADDGVSHHDACRATIIGGEYYSCGKGGVSTPTYGASGYINGVYSHDNTRYGIYVSGDSTTGVADGIACNCACKDNGLADISVLGTSSLVGWSNKYDTLSIADTATFVNLDAS